MKYTSIFALTLLAAVRQSKVPYTYEADFLRLALPAGAMPPTFATKHDSDPFYVSFVPKEVGDRSFPA